MMQSLHIPILLLVLGSSIVHGFSNGLVTPDACTSGPRHGPAQVGTAPFELEVTHSDGQPASEYTPGETLTVTIRSTDGGNLNGFLLWALENGGECSTGTWIAGDQQRTRSCNLGDSCSNSVENAVAHSSSQRSPAVSTTFNVPTTATGSLQFIAHIVRNYSTFWMRVASQILLQVQPTTPSTTPPSTTPLSTTTAIPKTNSIKDILTTASLEKTSIPTNSVTTTIPAFTSTSTSNSNSSSLTNVTTTAFLPAASNITDNANSTALLGFTSDSVTLISTDTANTTTSSHITENTTLAGLLDFTTTIPTQNFNETTNGSTIPQIDAAVNSAQTTPNAMVVTITTTNDTTISQPDAIANLTGSANVTDVLGVTVVIPIPQTNATANSTETTEIPTSNTTKPTNATTGPQTDATANVTGNTMLTDVLDFTTQMPTLNVTETTNLNTISQVDGAANLTGNANATDVLSFTTEIPILNVTESVNATTTGATNLTETIQNATLVTTKTTNVTTISQADLIGNSTGNADATDVLGFTTGISTLNVTESVNVTTTGGANVTEITQIPTPIINATTTSQTNATENTTGVLDFTTDTPSLNVTETTNGTAIAGIDIGTNVADNATAIPIQSPATEAPTLNVTEAVNTTATPIIDTAVNATQNTTGQDVQEVTTPSLVMVNVTETSNKTINATADTVANVTAEDLLGFTTIIPEPNVNENITATSITPVDVAVNVTENSTATQVPDVSSLTVNVTETANATATPTVDVTVTVNVTENFNFTSAGTPILNTNITDNTTTTPQIDTAGNVTVNTTLNEILDFTTTIPALNGNETIKFENLTTTVATDVGVANETENIENMTTVTPLAFTTGFIPLNSTENATAPPVTENPVVNSTYLPPPNLTLETDGSSNISGIVTDTPIQNITSTPNTLSFTSTPLPDLGTPPTANQQTTLIDFHSNVTEGSNRTTLPNVTEQPLTEINTTMTEQSSTSTSTTTSKPTTTTTPTSTTKTTIPTTTTTPPPQENPKADPANQPQQISFKLDGDFDKIVGPDPLRAKEDITKQLATIMNVDPARIQDLELTKGSVQVDFTLAPAEDTDTTNTNEAVKNLETFMDSNQKMEVNGNSLPTMKESLKRAAVGGQEETGLRQSTKIVLGVVFGLIGVAIIIAIIVICLRQRKSHGFLMMRAARKDYGIPLRSMDNGRNGASNGRQGHNNQGFSRT